MGATIEGKGRLFAKEHDGWTAYTIGVSGKTQDGRWVNAYQPVRFKKDMTPPPNGTDIEFTAFPTAKEKTVEGRNRNYIVWQIMTFKAAEQIPEVIAPFTALDSADIPF